MSTEDNFRSREEFSRKRGALRATDLEIGGPPIGGPLKHPWHGRSLSDWRCSETAAPSAGQQSPTTRVPATRGSALEEPKHSIWKMRSRRGPVRYSM